MEQGTIGICGRTGFGSSRTFDLQRFLASRLRRRLAGTGCSLFVLTWSQWNMPSGPPIFARLASVPLRSASGSSSAHWPTPRRSDGDRSATASDSEVVRKGGPQDLNKAADLAGWMAPQARDWKCTETAPRMDRRAGGLGGLDEQAGLAVWPAPTAKDAASSRNATANRSPSAKKANSGLTLTDAAPPSPRSPPTAHEKQRSEEFQQGRQLNALEALGPAPTGSTVGTSAGGRLKPEHSRWLMGFPIAWDVFADSETRSSRK